MAQSKSFRLRSPSLNTIRLRRIFDIFDENKDGEITVRELNRALDKLGLKESPDELQSAIKDFVMEGKSGLAFEGFVELHQSLGDSIFGPELEDKEEEDESDLIEAFHVFDEDGDGFICARELQSVLRKLGFYDEGEDIGRVNAMICSVDKNKDGLVDFHEFRHMMVCISAKSS